MWQRATTLAERSRHGRPTQFDREHGDRRWARWQTLPAFRVEGASDDHVLAPLGVGAADLRDLLAETDRSLRARITEEPAWVTDLERWWHRGEDLLAGGHPAPTLDLLTPVVPAVLGARAELGAALAGVGLPEAIAGDVIASLCDAPPVEELSTLVTPAMVLELNVARERGELVGSDARQRFEGFVATLRDPQTAWEILCTYPVLLRGVADRLAFWTARSVELAARLAADHDALVAELWSGAAPQAARLDLGRGDSHRGGRSVAVLTTDVGRAVYKPRSAAMDRALDIVLESVVASTDAAEGLRVPACVAGDDHAWFEHIDERDPRDDEVGRCVTRLGALTAVLHCLRTTDMHFENVRVDGAHPVPVDLESVLHTERQYATRETQDLHNPAFDALESSTLSVGTLPCRLVSGRAGDLVAADVSVFGPREDQLSLVAVPQMVGTATDEVRIESARAPLGSPPAGHGPRPLPLDEQSFTRGFAETYRTIIRTQDAWVRPGGLLSRFDRARTRFIPRPTMVYGKVLAESYHPDFLHDALDRTMCLGKLLVGYWGRPDREALLGCEIADLLVGDIPFFEIEAGSGRVRHQAVPAGFGPIGAAPVDEAARYVRDEVGEAGLAVELEVIRLAFASARVAARAAAEHGDPAPVATELAAASPAPVRASSAGGLAVLPPVGVGDRGHDEDRLLTSAGDLADRLRRSAVRRGSGIGWLSLTAATSTDWVVTPATMDSYSGLSGIAQALATVGAATGERRHAELAEEVLDQLAGYDRLLGDDPEAVAKTRAALTAGAYGHLAGMGLALADGARRYGRPDLLAVASRSARLLGELVAVDEECDVVGGSAGVVLAALAMDGVDVADDLVRRAGHRLVATARDGGDGALVWPQSSGGTPLVGYSHGTTGIALALARAGRALDDAELMAAAVAALRYDRTGLVRETGDWVDLREDAAPDAAVHMRAWCHGSPGAGLGRAELLDLGLLPALGPELHEETGLAIVATAQSLAGPGTGNLSLCHGDVGNLLALEAMLAASGESEVRARTAPLWSAVCERGRRDDWPCGVPGGTHVPGLMMGIAGIAWGLAYAARPQDELHMLTLRRTPAGAVSSTVRGPG